MKFHLELTAGRFIRKSIRQNLENTKKKLEFNFPECRVLVKVNLSGNRYFISREKTYRIVQQMM